MLTQRSRYALRAMLLLAKQSKEAGPLPMSTIAKDGQVPRKFLEVILTELREAGMVESHRGKWGGFTLAKPPHLISFGDIIRKMEGPLALVPCVSHTAYKRCKDCHDEASCAIRRAMMVVRDDTARILDGTSLADAIAEERQAA
jgi:Rrf2 family protein